MSYIGNEPIVSATRTVTEIIATAGQTVFTANGGYTVGYLDVFLNGAQLQNTDFTATNGSSVTLSSAAQSGDDIRLVAWGTFSTGTHVLKAGDTMTGALALPSLNVNSGTQNPLSETFTTVVRSTGVTNRAMYFDGGTGGSASVWWGGGNTPQFAIDSMPGGGIQFWTHASGTWVNRAQIQANGQWVSTSPNSSTLLPAFDCRAWVNFNGTGTVAIRASGNVSSITDNGAGDYTVNFANAMPDANYIVNGLGGLSSVTWGFVIPCGLSGLGTTNPNSTTQTRFRTVTPGDVALDNLFCNVAIFR